jgi:predicted O-methyltransferase YrrM
MDFDERYERAMEGLRENAKYPLIMHGIGGMLSRPEACWLHRISNVLGDGIYAELGTHHGRSAVLLADTMRNKKMDATLITVDIFDDRGLSRRFREGKVVTQISKGKTKADWKHGAVVDRIKKLGLSDYINVVKSLTAPAARDFQGTKLKFLFIDAGHDYDNVKADFEAWSPLILEDGVLAFHDSTTSGVSKVLEEIEGWEEYDRIDSLSVWRRK